MTGGEQNAFLCERGGLCLQQHFSRKARQYRKVRSRVLIPKRVEDLQSARKTLIFWSLVRVTIERPPTADFLKR